MNGELAFDEESWAAFCEALAPGKIQLLPELPEERP